ncbi:MAG: hypothetical protein HC913_02405 [Microscillaceae bacterium]|nr:hypothetical protein [Microscillaceae bacterium]
MKLLHSPIAPLVSIWLGLVLAIDLRASVEATHYTSPDSRFYFWVAENMKAGNGLSSPDYAGYPFDSGSRLYIFSTWPAGYPAFIALVAWIGQISPLVASKAVNLFFLGLLFALFYRWWGKEAWFPALYFFSTVNWKCIPIPGRKGLSFSLYAGWHFYWQKTPPSDKMPGFS